MCEPALNVELGIVLGSGGVVTALINEVTELKSLAIDFLHSSESVYANTVLIFLKRRKIIQKVSTKIKPIQNICF